MDQPAADPVMDELAGAVEAGGTGDRAGARARFAALWERVGDGFLPSLHLNLADVHRRLGEDARARHHLSRAREKAGALPGDGYGAMIRAGIERCGARLDAGERT
ncbi:hypothetical protein [Pseudonocardia spirodelae]|uniref:Tetratricopeptide repeat protein n=1 Tax=Pseudonocardia spirodelae TaxID=3133431 RepID=A0ABU8T1T1_9PSEU